MTKHGWFSQEAHPAHLLSIFFAVAVRARKTARCSLRAATSQAVIRMMRVRGTVLSERCPATTEKVPRTIPPTSVADQNAAPACLYGLPR